MYALVPSFMKKIKYIRKREIDCLWKYATLAATTIVFAVHSPFMVCLVFFSKLIIYLFPGQVFKMYAWEPSFMKKIQDIRKREIDCLWKYATLAATTIVFSIHSPFMVRHPCYILQ